jgi:hypothetical protein
VFQDMEARTRELELGGPSNARWSEINGEPTNHKVEKRGRSSTKRRCAGAAARSTCDTVRKRGG